MNKTILYDWHIAHHAQMADFAGFSMPLQYPLGPVEEHLLCRRSLGFFDIDHMGQLKVCGRGAEDFLASLLSCSIHDLAIYGARYALLLDERGGVLDDLFLYRLPDCWWIVVNASNRSKDFAHIKSLLPPGLSLEDISDSICMIALQGPMALTLLDAVTDGVATQTQRFSSAYITVAGVQILFGRTGYTGEDGGELFIPAGSGLWLWEYLLAKAKDLGIEAAALGLAARDSLRFEAGMPLHGHEISPSIDPLSAGLQWACDFSKDFIGKSALLSLKSNGLTKKLVTVETSDGIARQGCIITDVTLQTVGISVSGMYCPSSKKMAANCFVPPSCASIGSELRAIIRNKPRIARVVKRPLYMPVYRRS